MTVEEIRSDRGVIWVQLSDEPNSFPQGGKRVSVVPARPGSINVTFRHLKPGTYAVFVYHDANDNAMLDMSFLGIPTEGVGYSNKATGMPSFKASALSVLIDSTLSVKLTYYQVPDPRHDVLKLSPIPRAV